MLQYAALGSNIEQLIPLKHNMLRESERLPAGCNPRPGLGSSPPRPFIPFLHFGGTPKETDILRWKVDRLLDDLAEIEPCAFLAAGSNLDGSYVAASIVALVQPLLHRG